MLVNQGYVSFPVTPYAEAKVSSALASINDPHFGVEIYTTNEEKAVAYLYFLIKDHPFTDGNKRTATLAFATLCSINDLQPDFQGLGLDSLAIFIEKIREQDHHIVIKAIAGVLFD